MELNDLILLASASILPYYLENSSDETRARTTAVEQAKELWAEVLNQD